MYSYSYHTRKEVWQSTSFIDSRSLDCKLLKCLCTGHCLLPMGVIDVELSAFAVVLSAELHLV